MKTAQSKKAYSYLALGDSYTIGEQLPLEENFPAQLVRMMQEKGKEFEPPRILAATGWTTGELLAAIRKSRLRKKYDFVTLLIGVNNQYRGLSIADYVLEFEQLLKIAIGFAGDDAGHVIVLSIPDWAFTPFAKGRDTEQITATISQYNNANRQISDRYQAHYLDITAASRNAATDPSLLAEDGLHYAAKVYTGWAAELSHYIDPRTEN